MFPPAKPEGGRRHHSLCESDPNCRISAVAWGFALYGPEGSTTLETHRTDVCSPRIRFSKMSTSYLSNAASGATSTRLTPFEALPCRHANRARRLSFRRSPEAPTSGLDTPSSCESLLAASFSEENPAVPSVYLSITMGCDRSWISSPRLLCAARRQPS